MDSNAPLFLFVVRSTILVVIGYGVIYTLLRFFKVAVPYWQRLGALTVLLLGWLGFGYAINIPEHNMGWHISSPPPLPFQITSATQMHALPVADRINLSEDTPLVYANIDYDIPVIDMAEEIKLFSVNEAVELTETYTPEQVEYNTLAEHAETSVPPKGDVIDELEAAIAANLAAPNDAADDTAGFVSNTNVSVTATGAISDRIGVIFMWLKVIFVITYFGGMSVVLLRIRHSYKRFQDAVSDTESAPSEWENQWQEILTQNNCQRVKIPMRVTDAVGPALVQQFSGCTLVVPRWYWEKLDAESRAVVLRHELAHYLRKDGIKSLLVRLLALPQWFNPLTWRAVRRFDEAAEWACDEWAIGGDQDNLSIFAEALVTFSELASTREAAAFQSAFAGKRKPSIRISRLVELADNTLNKENNIMKKITILTAICLLLLIGIFQIKLVAVEETQNTEAQNVTETATPQAAQDSYFPPEVQNFPSPATVSLTKTEANEIDKMINNAEVLIKYKLVNVEPMLFNNNLNEFFSDKFVILLKNEKGVFHPVERDDIHFDSGVTFDSKEFYILSTLDTHRKIKAFLTKLEKEITDIQGEQAAEAGYQYPAPQVNDTPKNTELFVCDYSLRTNPELIMRTVARVLPECKITLDNTTNSLIIIAPEDVHDKVASLIKKLEEDFLANANKVVDSPTTDTMQTLDQIFMQEVTSNADATSDVEKRKREVKAQVEQAVKNIEKAQHVEMIIREAQAKQAAADTQDSYFPPDVQYFPSPATVSLTKTEA
ncbi:MAG: M56 family metallopeptidase, partial [Thermoguttaceae bacterium]